MVVAMMVEVVVIVLVEDRVGQDVGRRRRGMWMSHGGKA